VLANVLSEVGTLYRVSLDVFSGHAYQFLLKSSYLTDKEQKISWHFFETRCFIKEYYKQFCVTIVAMMDKTE